MTAAKPGRIIGLSFIPIASLKVNYGALGTLKLIMDSSKISARRKLIRMHAAMQRGRL
jgi:hypothetical protein